MGIARINEFVEVKYFIRDHNNVLRDLREAVGSVNQVGDAEVVVLWQDVIGKELRFSNEAKEMGIPLFVMEHGYLASQEYGYMRHSKIKDKLMVWGDKARRLLMEVGTPEDKVIVTGSTIHSHMPEKSKSQGKRVLFCPIHWDGDIQENRDIADKLKGFEVRTKILHEHGLDYQSPVISNRHGDGHLEEIGVILKETDILVSNRESTFETLALAMDIPVVVVNHWHTKDLNGVRYTDINKWDSDASAKATLDTLSDVVKRELKYPERLAKERNQFRLDSLGYNMEGTALERILGAIS